MKHMSYLGTVFPSTVAASMSFLRNHAYEVGSASTVINDDRSILSTSW
jgi:hypothetical protein